MKSGDRTAWSGASGAGSRALRALALSVLFAWMASLSAVRAGAEEVTPDVGEEPRRLSMQFHAVDIRAALATIAEFSGVNIVASDSVSGHITLRLQRVSWPVALETILQAKGLAQRRQDGVIWVAPRAEITARERQDYEHRAAVQQLEPVQTRSFQLNYAKALDVMTHLLSPAAGGGFGGGSWGGSSAGWGTGWGAMGGYASGAGAAMMGLGTTGSQGVPWGAGTVVGGAVVQDAGATVPVVPGSPAMSALPPWPVGNPRLASGGGALSHGHPRFLSARGVALAEPRTNQLFVTDVPSRLDAVQRMLAQVDVPLRQVMIEARIVEAGDSFARSLGARLAAVDVSGRRSQAGNNASTAIANTRLEGQGDKTPDVSGQLLNLPAASLAGQDPGALAFSFFNAARTRLLAVELSALESEGQGRVVSNPRVVTADQVKAVIEQGTELPYQATTGNGAHSISFRKANLRLEVTPQITPEGGIILEVDLSKDSVGQLTPAGFEIDTKHLSTQVLVDDGGTVVIGGIYETSDSGQHARLPWLGRLPLVGALFGNRQHKRQKQELLVFLTPKMLSQRASAP